MNEFVNLYQKLESEVFNLSSGKKLCLDLVLLAYGIYRQNTNNMKESICLKCNKEWFGYNMDYCPDCGNKLVNCDNKGVNK
jgi:rRNA maturation endonuclease Nob1